MKISIKARLIALLAMLGALLFTSVALGTYALRSNSESLETIFRDRIVPLSQFSTLRDAYDAILVVVRTVDTPAADRVEAATTVDRELARAQRVWTEYLATYLTPEEKQLIADLEPQLGRNAAILTGLSRALKAQEPDAIAAAKVELLHAMAPTSIGISRLTDLQVREARAQFDRADAMARRLRILLLIMLAAAAIAVAYGVVVILVQVTRPIGETTATMNRLASGDLAVRLGGAERRDEIGAMVRAVQIFKDALVAKREADEAAATEQAVKTLRAERLDHATRAFRIQVERMTHTLAHAASEMEAAARVMSRNADQTAAKSVNVSSAAEQTSANVQTVAAASEELAVSIGAINGQIARSSDMAERAAADAAETNALVMGLADGAERIGTVISLIAGIAAQTSLLALNATIEAGEAGQGFAVVAGEVKQLATQTAKATETIAAQVAAIQGETHRAVDAIQAITTTVLDLRTIAVAVAASMEEQGAVTQEIVRNVNQAADGTQAVTLNIGSVSQAAAETGTAAAQVLEAASDLSRQSGELSTAVTEFLAAVHAA
ncbi:methyl-accepting chemotaxis protein [Methylobacterium sp. PvR107]|uniref:methyl-accepting chemotaxis protein n=1 Tax=Methylobacterium sp. PvR107 TaxID=2806597 RepID=UPI001AEAFF5D|nr:methyl-accepting chemotaxis protein [Methylobacterium sp. PvR107]MBP1179458.1 methyl-accepting chemotaxis protein [Methylobacterium sp. PvR107]